MPTFHCPVTWPAEAGEGDLIPAYARPRHECARPAEHIHDRVPGVVMTMRGETLPAVAPHLCHCGAVHLVRDAGQGR